MVQHSSTYLMTEKTKSPLILAVDDDRTVLMLLEEQLKLLDYKVLTAKNGKEACNLIEKHKLEINVIILDREMPLMNGMEVIAWLKENEEYAKIPVIMQTGYDKPEQIKEGIDSGVFYYLIKPINTLILKSVMSSAIDQSRHHQILREEMRRHGSSFQLVDYMKFTIRTLSEAENLSCFLANCFPNPEKVLSGIAELLINAVEHGNLKISYEEKTKLIATGNWREEIDKRAKLPAFIDKKVVVYFQRTKDACIIKVIDEGEGFNWQEFMDINPARATDTHGRGIAQAKIISFDVIRYNDKGNEVTALVSLATDKTEIEW